MSQITGRVRRLSDLSYQDLCNLIGWSTSNVGVDNESLLVGSATNEEGQPLAYVTAEPTLLISGYAISPAASEADAGAAGDAIDKQLGDVAGQLGVGRFFIIIPSDAPKQPQERVLRVIERPIPSRFEVRQLAFDRPSPSAYVN
jgi:hypothetical protein